MNPQDSQTRHTNSTQQMETDVTPSKSRLSIVGLVLAILLPPVGLVVSIVALRQAGKNHSRGKGKAIFGIVWGTIFTLPILVVAWFAIEIINNPAKNDIRPLTSGLQALGGKELCEDGDSGYGGDNTQPWSEVYYQVPNSSKLTSQVKQYAAQSGYTLVPNTGLITELKNVADHANVTDTLPPNEPPYSTMNDYFVASKSNGGSLTVVIYRDTAVPLDCGVVSYGKLQPTGKNNAFIDMQLTLPNRE